MKFISHRALALSMLLGTGSLLAQDDVALVTDIVATPNYFLVVLFGVMLAIGFQFLLTSLSVAIGVSAIPNLKKTYAEARYETGPHIADPLPDATPDAPPVGFVSAPNAVSGVTGD